MIRQPVLVFEGPKETLTAARTKALSRSLTVAVFTSDLFGTGNDRDNRAAVRAVGRDALDLVGLLVYGPRNAVDKALKGARMHPSGRCGVRARAAAYGRTCGAHVPLACARAATPGRG